ncbi:hypothetical protein DIPPA_30847 [Diplonema papillatum]|nr:hypothetical protein DIPPA_30847 [Diplonema papillatum]
METIANAVNGAVNRVWQFKAWIEPHLWVVTTTGLILCVSLIFAGEIDKSRLLSYNGRLRDRLVVDGTNSGAELENRLISLDTGNTGAKEEELF